MKGAGVYVFILGVLLGAGSMYVTLKEGAANKQAEAEITAQKEIQRETAELQVKSQTSMEKKVGSSGNGGPSATMGEILKP